MTLTDHLYLNRFTFTTLENMMNDLFYRWENTSKPPVSALPIFSDSKKESIQGVEIQYALAGFKESDIRIWHENNVLYIEGDNTNNKELSDKFRCKFSQKFPVSKDLDLTKSSVKLENGLLSIYVPIAEKEDKKVWLLNSKRLEE